MTTLLLLHKRRGSVPLGHLKWTREGCGSCSCIHQGGSLTVLQLMLIESQINGCPFLRVIETVVGQSDCGHCGCRIGSLRARRTAREVSYSMCIGFMHFQEVFGAQFFLTDIAHNSTTIGRLSRIIIKIDSMHLLHVSLHEILVAQFFIANVAIICWRSRR